MKKLVKYLSPFAPDQSGACGVLYELGGLMVVCDAGGCAGNICGFDEPRWFTKRSAVFSAGLRDMDAILGRDDKLIKKLNDELEAKGFITIAGRVSRQYFNQRLFGTQDETGSNEAPEEN